MSGFRIFHWLIVIFIYFLPATIGVATMGWQKSVLVKHNPSGLLRKAYYNYSLTYFFFGWLVPIFRGEIGIGALHFIFTILTFGIFQLVMPFLYNKQYTTRLLTKGWMLSDNAENESRARLRLGIAAPSLSPS